MATRTTISTTERRARLVARHHLDRTADDPVAVVRGVAAVHSTDPATPYLGAWARLPEFTIDVLDRALFDDRTLWRRHAMRRTLFVTSTADGAIVDAAAARDVAHRERRRLAGWLAEVMPADDVDPWLAQVEDAVVDAMGDDQWRTQDLAPVVPELATELTVGSGRWTTTVKLGSRLLYLLAMDGRLVRARPAGSWRSSQYLWAVTECWFDGVPEPLEPATGRAELARRYLAAHGPATLTDVRWWTGWTVRHATAALGDAGAVQVSLDDGDVGFVLPGDVDVATPPSDGPVIALLPALDSTPMGWKDRDWYLDGHDTALFDRNGNVGPTVWLDGRIVGGWAQRADGHVVHRVLTDVGAPAARRIADEAAALSEWLDGTVVIPRFRTPLEKQLAS